MLYSVSNNNNVSGVSLHVGCTAGQSNNTREENTEESFLLQRGQEPDRR